LNGRSHFFNEDDLYQEAVVHLWTDFKEGKLSDKTSSYVLQGCYFYLKNYIRKTQDGASLVRLSCLGQDQEEIDLENFVSLKNPKTDLDDLSGKILLEDIQREPWTEREKDVLSLSLSGLTVREIGLKLGVSHVAIVKIRNKIKDKCQKFRNFF
jgi:RNA polymerase sigma factor (sigma-70 family)